MNLREAADRTYRSVTTLRRYIRSGRLHAEKRDGRYGPEYFVSEDDLRTAGLAIDPDEAAPREPDTGLAGRTDLPTARSDTAALAPPAAREGVPVDLFRELQMKHEQLLVQYGMMRTGGLRALELQREVEEREADLERLRAELAGQRSARARDVAKLERDLRQARFELEGRSLEIAALREKIRGLERFTAERAPNVDLQERLRQAREQVERVGLRRGRLRGDPPAVADDGSANGAAERPAERRATWRVRPVPDRRPDR